MEHFILAILLFCNVMYSVNTKRFPTIRDATGYISNNETLYSPESTYEWLIKSYIIINCYIY